MSTRSDDSPPPARAIRLSLSKNKQKKTSFDFVLFAFGRRRRRLHRTDLCSFTTVIDIRAGVQRLFTRATTDGYHTLCTGNSHGRDEKRP